MVGAAAFQGGYSPGLSMIPGFNPGSVSGQNSQIEEEPGFLKNMPVMSPPINSTPMAAIPTGTPRLVEGQESNHAPMAALPDGLSALDAVRYSPVSDGVKTALTKNYSQMMKLIDKKIDKKKGKV